MDDICLLGAPDTVIPTVPTHKLCLKEVGLDFNDTKTKCYIGPRFHTNRYQCMLGSMDEGMLQTPDGTPVYG
eukprot:1972919-Ditylum_brightwellii.AAC.1